MSMTAPIPLPYATPRTSVEVNVDQLQLLPRNVIRIPRWVAESLAVLECLRHGHATGRVTLAQDGKHHCLTCGKALERRH